MESYLGVGSLLLALLLATGGVAAIRRGWIFSYQRRWIHRTPLFGWAQLVMAGSFLLQAVDALLVEDPDLGIVVSNVGFVALASGLALSVLAQRPRQDG
ncbi:hypothetical protein ACFV9D_11025 [Streptomyces sp. NPDC059875]|uniref:hypothetical protein n=1 Tax=unclassified Streptomyces TaxID=2593676 RepID=UPI00366872F3